jgi:hypothetical protein
MMACPGTSLIVGLNSGPHIAAQVVENSQKLADVFLEWWIVARYLEDQAQSLQDQVPQASPC